MSKIKKRKICKNCDNEIKDLRCKYCCDECRIEFNKKKGAPNNLISRIIDRKKKDDYHDCICPGCGKLHQVKMYWSGGKITPRIRCTKCKDLAVYHQPTEITVRMS